ncbi:helix-turn-helix domain-containing protein [Domibacillus sp. A3M-37]|uniref:MerR family transcriptional regulator n=1 Tax=Domibacillus sp. A3M-37 TaxID=2962037 RepID=UPI0020B77FD6|nr:MerR family transcriptional regulator [Domibacillus sp. A3M-37]MCP3763682.1 helix-turn-helix domain-containing protein [Domibacillus sp. A3M-37]
MIKIANQTQDQRAENLSENLEEMRLTVKEAAKQVNESPSVVRNWMRELKTHIPTVQGENGYHYFDKPALERLMLIQKLNREQNYSIKQIEYYFATGETKAEPEEMEERSSGDIRKDLDTILERLERQEQFNQALVMKLDEQQQYIKDSLNKRDQLLLESLKNTQDAKKAEIKKKRFFNWFN